MSQVWHLNSAVFPTSCLETNSSTSDIVAPSVHRKTVDCDSRRHLFEVLMRGCGKLLLMRVVEFVTFAGKAVGRNDLEVEVLVLSFGRRALMSDCREGAGGSRARVTLARAKSPRMASNRS